jgi:hypothetical protein
LNEGFEGDVIPPDGWTQVINNPNETWQILTYNPHSGVRAADVVYDPALIPQDEWLLSPEFPALGEGTLSLWSFGSLYWCRDTYDNCDLNVWLVVGDVGGGDDVFVGRADDDWTGTWTWSQSVFNLTPLLPGGPVRIGLQYSGLDGAQIALDDVVLDGTSGGACVAPEDVPWLSASPDSGTTPPGDSAGVDVTFDATGLAPGDYAGALCVNSNDPATPLVVVPVEMTVEEPSAATDSALCVFDRNPDTDEREFRLLFTPDLQNWPSYKLTASNPGQFFYNVFYAGDGPATFEITLPYPFVTQGAMPVHVYSDVAVYVNEDGATCFIPGAEEASYPLLVTLDDHTDTDGDGKPDSFTVTLTDVPVVDGFAYLNVHLDYGLKGDEERYEKAVNPDGTNDAVDFETGEILIEDRTPYPFSAQVNAVPLDSDAIANANEFKRIAGVAGFVRDTDGNMIEGALVRLIIPEGVKFDEPYLDAITDEDGWYMIEYKHKGKPTDYPIQLWIDGNLVVEDTVHLRGNAFAEKHFTVPSP